MKLNELHDNAGARTERLRKGRGPGSGKGKTAGRGAKGQKSRSGVAIKGFEGGQMPLYRRLPKRGFTNPTRKVYAELTLGRLQRALDQGALASGAELNSAALLSAGVVKRSSHGVKLLGGGALTSKVALSIEAVSAAARAAVEAAGGSVTLPVPPEKKVGKRAQRRDEAQRKRMERRADSESHPA